VKRLNGVLILKYTETFELPALGIFYLTINDAAELIVMDMWYSGEIPEINEPDNWDGTKKDPNLIRLLSGHTGNFKEKLRYAINNGTLKSSVMKRDFDNLLILEETYIDNEDIQDWLIERNYPPGDIWSEWFYDQIDILNHVTDELSYARIIINRGEKIPKKYPLSDSELDELNLSADAKLLAAYKGVVIENQEFKEQLKDKLSQRENKADRPLNTRQRKTWLIIIAALCDSVNIDFQARGASQRIKALTELLGVPIDDETIRTLLSEIPDALETRSR
jgi:hypothetical protein